MAGNNDAEHNWIDCNDFERHSWYALVLFIHSFRFHNMSDIYNCRGFEILYISGVVNHDESNFGAILVLRLNCQKNLRNQMSSLQHQVYNTCINQFELLASFFSRPEQLNGWPFSLLSWPLGWASLTIRVFTTLQSDPRYYDPWDNRSAWWVN